MDFTAIDVETANPDLSSICQIGIARFSDGELVDEWSTLIDPEDYFDSVNVSIHGIEQRMVKGQPKLPKVAEHIRRYLEKTVSVCHTHFDRVALSRAFAKYNLQPINTAWLDSARVVRRTWQDLAWKGYGLANVCKKIGYEFKHHDALEDAKAAGYVLVAALRESRQDLDAWQHRVNQPIDLERSIAAACIQREGNPDGDLFGEVIVFTGALELHRREAADWAANVGCRVSPGVSKTTTILVVGNQDAWKLGGHTKSAKHRRVEQLVVEGHSIRVISEVDFKLLVQSAQTKAS